MERIRIAREKRIQEELEEEAEKKRRLLNRKLREHYATELALLRAPPPPPPPSSPSSSCPQTSDEHPTSSSVSNWVPLLPNEEFQNASQLAGYGQKQQHPFSGHHLQVDFLILVFSLSVVLILNWLRYEESANNGRQCVWLDVFGVCVKFLYILDANIKVNGFTRQFIGVHHVFLRTIPHKEVLGKTKKNRKQIRESNS